MSRRSAACASLKPCLKYSTVITVLHPRRKLATHPCISYEGTESLVSRRNRTKEKERGIITKYMKKEKEREKDLFRVQIAFITQQIIIVLCTNCYYRLLLLFFFVLLVSSCVTHPSTFAYAHLLARQHRREATAQTYRGTHFVRQ